MLKYYRDFFLKYICENQESRKPYIYYNTWNYQERNRNFNHSKYLDSMHIGRIMDEIDIAYHMGVDVYVIDTGWFIKTGDSFVNTARFPDGLKDVKKKLADYGMKMGLWFNPTTAAKTSEERQYCFSFKMVMEMIGIVEEVTATCPEAIVDFDVTEVERNVGLGFLSVGKYFLVNNGPYAMDFDLPEKFIYEQEEPIWMHPWTNMMFYPGAARSRFCRQCIKYDSFIPSILFLTHYLPDKPLYSQNNSLASLVLGGNGIWGDLLSLTDEDIKFFNNNIGHFSSVDGADSYEVTPEGRLKVTVILDSNDARVVYIL